MFFDYIEDEDYTQVSAEVDDKCVLCALFDNCPLITALGLNVVYPSADKISIEECSLYYPETLDD